MSSIYQVLLPVEKSLESVLDEISIRLFKELKHSSGEPIQQPMLMSIRGIVADMLDKHTFHFRNCGLYDVCDQQSTPMDWNDKAKGKVSDKPHRFLHVWFQNGLEDLMDESVPQIMALDPLNKEPHAALKEKLYAIMKQELGQYLFENHVCSHADVCKSNIKDNPWKA